MAAIRPACEPAGWRKSSHSDSGNCVEVRASDLVHVRDSKRPGENLTVGAEAWQRLLENLR